MRIAIVLGYSGIGKTTLGRYAEKEKGWLHLEMDPSSRKSSAPSTFLPPSDGKFTRHYFEALRVHLRTTARDTALITMGSVVIGQEASDKLQSWGATTVYLMAPPYFCFEQFLKREAALENGLSAFHWVKNNARLCEFLSSPIAEGSLKFLNATQERERFELGYLLNLMDAVMKNEP